MVESQKEKFDPIKFEGVTGWEALGVKPKTDDVSEFYEIYNEVWRDDKCVYFGKAKRKEGA